MKQGTFKSLGYIIGRYRWWVLLAGVIVMGLSVQYGLGVFSRLDSSGFASPKFESYQAMQELNAHFGNSDQSLIVLFASRDGLKATDPRYRAAVDQALSPARRDHRVTTITDYYTTPAPSFISRDGTKTYAVIRIGGSLAQANTATTDLRPQLTSSTLSVKTGGFLGINQDFNTQIQHDLGRAEIISFILLAILLVIVFRGLAAAVLPLVLGGFGVLGAFLVIRLLTNVMTISQYAINVIILLGLGLSIDYSLFMVSRFREELRTRPAENALTTTMQTAGRTVFFSGLTVILSLLGLLLFPINFLKSMGVGASAAVGVAMLGALTILPALLAVLGRRVNALSFGAVRREYRGRATEPPAGSSPRHTGWYRLARLAMRWPVVTIGLIIIPLAFLAQFTLRVTFSSADERSLPSSTQGRQVAESLNQDFAGTPADPIQVVAHVPATSSAELAAQLARYHNQLVALPGVTTVNPPQPGSNSYYLYTVSYNAAPDQPLARDLVTNIRTLHAPTGWQVKVGGFTAELIDLLDSLAHYALPVALTVAAALFILLFIMLRSLIVPLQALLVNILTLAATFGVLVWVFQEGHLEKLLGFTSVGSIDATQPVLVFGIAFGLSMDYAVFLLSRIKEQYDILGDVPESIAQGVERTGPIITSAAVLFMVVVGAFATSAIPLIKEIGLGLGLAVFIDAFFIRLLLIPAIMRLCGHANWWPGGRRVV